MKTEEGTIIEFLCGEKSFGGHWFSDGHNPFWWRKHLREYTAELKKENERLEERIKKYDEMHKLIGLHPKIEDWTAELQHLRELIAKFKRAIVEDAIHWDPAKANELLQDCKKALHPEGKAREEPKQHEP